MFLSMFESLLAKALNFYAILNQAISLLKCTILLVRDRIFQKTLFFNHQMQDLTSSLGIILHPHGEKFLTSL